MSLYGQPVPEDREPFDYTEGVKIRAAIDTEIGKSLMYLYGGGIAASLTFFAAVINSKNGKFYALGPALLSGVGILCAGLVLTVLHNKFRRKCALDWESFGQLRKGEKALSFRNCERSEAFLYLSIAAFVIAAAVVGYQAYSILAKAIAV
jgi:hypothetical protein